MVRTYVIVALCMAFITSISNGQESTMNCRPKKGCKLDVKCDATTEGFSVLQYLERGQFPLTCESKSIVMKSNQGAGIDSTRLFKMVTNSISEINKIKNEMKGLRSTNLQLSGELEKHKESHKLFQMELYQLGDVNKNQSDILNNYRTLLRSQNKDIKQLRGRSTELTVELMNLKNFKTDTEKDVKEMKEKYEKQFDELREQLEKQKQENEEMKKSVDFATKRVEEIQIDYEVFREESMDGWEKTSSSVAALTKENAELKEALSRIQNTEGGSEISIEEIEEKIQEEILKLQNDLNKASEEEQEEIQKEITKLRNAQKKTSEKNQEEIKKELTDIRDDSDDKIKNLIKKYNDIKKDINTVRKTNNEKIAKLEKEKMELEEEIRDLRNDTEAYIGTIQSMKNYLDEVKQKLYGFEEKVNEANDKLSRFANVDFNGQVKSTTTTPMPTTTTTQSTTTTRTTVKTIKTIPPQTTSVTEPPVSESSEEMDTCQMMIDGICYWSEVHPIWDTNYETAVSICTSHGSVIADVPNAESYRKISNYLRKSIPIGWNYIQIWTAKEINPPSGDLTPEGSFTKWYQHFPKRGRPYAEYTNIYLIVKRDVKDPNHGMANYPPTFSRNGVLCRREN